MTVARGDARCAAVDPAPVACKVCGGLSFLIGVVDFNKHCPSAPGFILELSGEPVYYRQCRVCGLVFTNHCDDWTSADFAARIYNERYLEVDPDFAGARAQANATFLETIFGAHRDTLTCLDYGGGDGALAAMLRDKGFAHARSCDPYHDGGAPTPLGGCQLVTSFEVLEHSPDPRKSIAELSSCIGDKGMAVFSTLVVPADFATIGVSWWYVAPRNGHLTFYTRDALGRLWGEHGFRFGSLNENLHVAVRDVPEFASHFIKMA